MKFSFKCTLFVSLYQSEGKTVPQARTKSRKRYKLHIQSRFLNVEFLCWREMCNVCMDHIRWVNKKLTNISQSQTFVSSILTTLSRDFKSLSAYSCREQIGKIQVYCYKDKYHQCISKKVKGLEQIPEELQLVSSSSMKCDHCQYTLFVFG